MNENLYILIWMSFFSEIYLPKRTNWRW